MHRMKLVVGLAALADICVPASAATWIVTSPTTLAANDFSHEGDDVIVEGTILYVNGAHTFASLSLRRDASNEPGLLRHEAAFADGRINGCSLTIDGDVSIEGPARGLVASQIDLWGWGFAPQVGPGAGATAWAASGGGHGGHGGGGQGTSAGGGAYGSFTEPTEFGSGGGYPSCCGAGGWGGGAIHLNVKGQVRVDGAINVNGGYGGEAAGWGGGAGAGGSIWIECAELTGSGMITANGGVSAYGGAVGGGGGGGRISLSFVQNTFTGLLSASGGAGAQRGGAGTIYVRDTDESSGELIVDNGGAPGAQTPWTGAAEFDGSLTIRGAGSLGVQAAQPLSLTFTGDVTLEADGFIDLVGDGQAAASGTGTGAAAWAASGGGYGGHGGAGGGTGAGGECYGSMLQPTDLGSGGGNPLCCGVGGSGGGALRLTVQGQLQVDGAISVDGSPGGPASGWGGGAGSGGSIWIECDELVGEGEIRANGGEGAYGNVGGGGGGGRIAIYGNTQSFRGAIRAEGGAGAQRGGAGSVYLQNSGGRGGLIFDNGGNEGATTEWTEDMTIQADVVVRDGAILAPPSGHLLHVKLDGSLHVDVSGRIGVNGYGYPPLEGSGAACAVAGGAPGGGYGGAGGSGSSSNCGGLTYGSVTQPDDFGSGGGGTRCCNPGGWGGGVIRLTITEVLNVDGVISSNGTPGIYMSGWGGGGGSGGSVWIECDALTGSGSIQAIGGAGGGDDLGGGGGGGRIAICGDSAGGFSGTIMKGGGAGYQDGEPGSLYLNITEFQMAQPADLDGNEIVDGADLGILLGHWECTNPAGVCGACHGADIDGSGLVDGADLGLMLGAWSTDQ